MAYIIELSGPLIILAAIIVLLILNNIVSKKFSSIKSDGKYKKGIISAIVLLLGIPAFILMLPVENTIKAQILSFIGILFSAGVALSSTTLLGNLLSGVMNNSMNRFRNGDLIVIGDLIGRVTKKRALHIELQLEDSNFISIPNLYVAQNPVKLTRKNNSVISTTVSLGYDVPRAKVETVLKKAAAATGLTNPYVYIKKLGDYSVLYQINGFLEDCEKYFSTISMLNGKVMDYLHAQKIEIVSPSFSNRRDVERKIFIPDIEIQNRSAVYKTSPENLVFDEAIKSEKVEEKKEYLQKIEKKKDVLKDNLKKLEDEEKIRIIKNKISRLDDLKVKLENQIKEGTQETD